MNKDKQILESLNQLGVNSSNWYKALNDIESGTESIGEQIMQVRNYFEYLMKYEWIKKIEIQEFLDIQIEEKNNLIFSLSSIGQLYIRDQIGLNIWESYFCGWLDNMKVRDQQTGIEIVFNHIADEWNNKLLKLMWIIETQRDTYFDVTTIEADKQLWSSYLLSPNRTLN
jgi:hypothetical protein